MARLEDVAVEDLEDALREYEEYRELRRLLAAILYKRGPSVPQLASWLDVREATIYRWFDRLEAQPPAEAVRDDPRPGRPSKLTPAQWERFRAAVSESPSAAGRDGDEWTTATARAYLEDAFGVTYSRRHVRRLLSSVQDD